MIRRKLECCIKVYGDIAYELLREDESCDEVWRIVCDLPMFAKAIYLTLLEFAFLGKEEIGDIIKCLTEERFLRFDPFEERYEIVYCPSETMHFEHAPYYLRLCFIVFILRKDMRTLIGSFIEASFLRENACDISDREKERFKVLMDKEGIEEIVDLYRKYSSISGKDISILRRYCDKVHVFVQTEVSEDSHRY